MTRILFYVVFISTAVFILLATHRYLYLRLVRDTALPAPWRQIGTALLLLLFLSQPAVFAVVKRLPLDQARALATLPYIWMGMLLYLVLFLFTGDVVRLGAWLVAKLSGGESPLADPARRVAISRAVAGVTVAATAGLTVLARSRAVSGATVRPVEVKLERLPASLDGTTIVQLSDLHLGPTLDGRWLEGIVEQTLAEEPDLVVITGDLVDASVQQLRLDVAPLRRLTRVPLGCYFVTGNHEYYVPTEPWLAELRRLGLRVLRNERVSVGRGAESFDLAGVDDFNAARHLPDHGPDLDAALQGRDPSRELVLLAHQPRAVHEAAQKDVGLVLSGHTHGGQFWPWTYFVYLQQPYIAGLFRHEGSRTQIYISEGTGFWGPPMRLGTRSEISRIVLRRAGAETAAS